MKSTIVLFGVLALVACNKDQPDRIGSSTVTGASTTTTGNMPPTADEIRASLMRAKPGSSDMINGLVIVDEGGTVTLRGTLPDDTTRVDVISRVRSMPNVKDVRDQIQVASQPGNPPSGGSMDMGMTGQPGSQPGQPAPMQGGQMDPMGHGRSTGTGDAIRAAMTKERPKAAAVIQGLTIADDGKEITITGAVPDQATHEALLKAAEKTASTKQERIKDEMHIAPTPAPR